MKKICLILIVVLLFTVMCGAAKNNEDGKNSEYKIAYLDGYSTETDSNIMRVSTSNGLILTNEYDAYVLNHNSFQMLINDNAANYLSDGGIIVVNDKEVNSGELKTKIETNVVDFDYSDEKDNYGFYVYNDGEKNITVNVVLGYLVPEGQNNFNHKDVTDEIEKEVLIEDIVKSAIKKQNSPKEETDTILSNDGRAVTDSNTSGQVIALANLEAFYYINSKKLACSYTIYTQVVYVATITDSAGEMHEIYDVVTIFTIDAEPSYAITEYSVKMKNYDTILDASYLNSTTSTTVSLGGSLGFQGNVIEGSLTAGVSYTYTPDSQEIVNDFPVGIDKKWHVTVVDPICNASRKIMPAIRVLNDPGKLSTEEFSRLESLKIQDDAWWIFKTKYTMPNESRKELNICWYKDGIIWQRTYTG